MDKVYIILVNYIKYNDTIECIESVLKSDYNKFQIILVDNSPDDLSTNNIVKWINGGQNEIATSFPEIVYPLVSKPLSYIITSTSELALCEREYNETIVIVKARNEGFASANNLGLKYVIKTAPESSFAWLLNNDTIIERTALTELVKSYKSSRLKLGIVSNKIFYYDKKKCLNGIGGVYNKWLGISSHVGESETDNGQFDNMDYNSTVHYPIGASMFVSKRFLSDVGLLNESFFLFFEEIDWVERSKVNDWKLGFAAKSVIYHKESASISPGNIKNILFETSFLSSKLIFTFNYFKRSLPLIYVTIIWMLFNRLRRRQFTHLMPLIKVALNPFGFKKHIVNKLNHKKLA